jgi:hypothetical protein
MMFAYPAFLWALAAVAIPIIIHLFNFRRYKKIYFSNVNFLKVIQTESKSKSKLREIFILISRILAISCLVLAFSQPVITQQHDAVKTTDAKHVGIYIDNSFSMDNVNKQGPLLESAKIYAKKIIEAYGSADRFYITTNNFEGKYQRLLSKEDAISLINDIKTISSSKTLDQILTRQKEFLAGKKNTSLYAISDLQKNTFTFPANISDSLVPLTILPVNVSNTNNISIDSCWFDSPLQQKGMVQKLHVRIKNKSEIPVEAGNIRLSINNQPMAAASYSIDANSVKEITIKYTEKNESFNYASLKTDDFPMTFDDELFFCYNSKRSVKCLLISGKECSTENYFKSLFETDSLFETQYLYESSVDYSKFKNADLIILNELSDITSGLQDELIKFNGNGSSLVIIPSEKSNLTSYNNFYKSCSLPQIILTDTHAVKMNVPNYRDPFFEGVFEKKEERINLPKNTSHLAHQQQNKGNYSDIYTFQNGNFFLRQYSFENSNIYLFTSPLNEKHSNFLKHALFVPTFIKFAVKSLSLQPLYLYLQNNSVIQIKPDYSIAETPPHLVSQNQKIDIIPEMKLMQNNLKIFPDNNITEAGYYDIVWNKNIITNLAFNHNRLESDMKFHTVEEMKRLIKENNWKYVYLIDDAQMSLSKTLQLGAGGVKLWKWFVLLSLLFILVEICLIRFIKT